MLSVSPSLLTLRHPERAIPKRRIIFRLEIPRFRETGIDNEMAERGFAGIGAWILRRNMFGPVRGPWPGESWKGWWGDEPPYHTPVFVLTHHPRSPLAMASGTRFRFVPGRECGGDEPLHLRVNTERASDKPRNAG